MEPLIFGPNITGKLSATTAGGDGGIFSTGNGAFSVENVSGAPAKASTNTRAMVANFEAHASNSIYTDSGAVIPLGLQLNYIIKT